MVEPDPNDNMDSRQAAGHLRLHPVRLAYLARQKKVPAQKVGRYWRFSRSELDAWLLSNPYPVGSSPSLSRRYRQEAQRPFNAADGGR